MIFLMNSPMMPTDGVYRRIQLPIQKWADEIGEKQFTSYIGYPQLANLLEDLLGRKIEVSRAETNFEQGDVAYVAQLVYRILSPQEKAAGIHGNSLEDYRFFRVEFFGKSEWLVSQYSDDIDYFAKR